MGFLWDVWLEKRISDSRAKGPELIIPSNIVNREKDLDKTSRIYNTERVKLQLLGRDFPQEHSDMIVLSPLKGPLHV